MTLRRLTAADLPGADNLRRLVGWNQTPADWARLLGMEPKGCFVALLEGVVVGTVTTTTYGQALAWIGMLLVHPDHRGRGLGGRLMRQALGSLRSRKVRCVKLDATPAGFPLYRRLGFVPEWTLMRHQRLAGSGAVVRQTAAGGTRDLGEGDWPAVGQLDLRTIGAPRSALLRGLARDSRRALVWPTEGPAVGWGLLRPGANADYLGPLACAGEEGPVTLAAALLRAAGDRAIYWDVPDQNLAAGAAARQFGFTPLRPLTRMRLGAETAAGGPCAQFAIADPAVG